MNHLNNSVAKSVVGQCGRQFFVGTAGKVEGRESRRVETGRSRGGVGVCVMGTENGADSQTKMEKMGSHIVMTHAFSRLRTTKRQYNIFTWQ